MPSMNADGIVSETTWNKVGMPDKSDANRHFGNKWSLRHIIYSLCMYIIYSICKSCLLFSEPTGGVLQEPRASRHGGWREGGGTATADRRSKPQRPHDGHWTVDISNWECLNVWVLGRMNGEGWSSEGKEAKWRRKPQRPHNSHWTVGVQILNAGKWCGKGLLLAKKDVYNIILIYYVII